VNVEQTIDAFRRDVLELDCKEMVLVQPRAGGERYRGAGYIRQTADGALTFKLYVASYENAEPLAHLLGHLHSPPGKLHPDDTYFELTAIGFDGTKWTAGRLLPAIDWDMEDNSALARGRIDRLSTCLGRSGEHHTLRLHFFEECAVPLHRMSVTEEHGVRP
jgi:hypothetical protein